MSTDTTDAIGSQFNQNPFNQWPLQPPSPAVSPEPFLRGMIHRCAVEYDSNADGSITNDSGQAVPIWRQVVGLEEVKCRIMLKESVPDEGGDKHTFYRKGSVQFGMAIVADRRNRLYFQDPDTLTTGYVYLTGPVRNVHMMNHHWRVEVQDRPLG